MEELLMPLLTGAVGAGITSGIFGIIMYRMKRKDEKTDKKDAQNEALKMIIYRDIKKDGKAYIERGYVDLEELEDLIKMHKVYHNSLNGNGFLDELMGQVKKLPIKEEKK